MIRKIININEEKCNGCGLCAQACHEGAIGMVHGKAKLLRDDYCDGLGDCLPACPTGAITFIEREAAAYDEAAVLENKKRQHQTAEKPLAWAVREASPVRFSAIMHLPNRPGLLPLTGLYLPSCVSGRFRLNWPL